MCIELRYLLIFLSLLVSVACISQSNASPKINLTISKGNTWGVVIGISDYQDPNIPKLRFAHRDAEAFANWLKSPAGGALDDDYLQVLINEEATAGRVALALDALVEKVLEGDQVLIYFSGHGDVERKTISQPGFLLCWDAPSRVYMGGGTYSLTFLQEIITTLSIQNKAKVFVFADACRSGKLAGSQIGGAQLTAANLSRQYSNEFKILSCQPDEFSIEGIEWGSGRGVFSYHLVNGLYGLADHDLDGVITLGEIDRYLGDNVTLQAAPHRQIPIIIGNRSESIAFVHEQTLSDLSQIKSGKLTFLASTGGRNVEEDRFFNNNPEAIELYRSFQNSLDNKRFFKPLDDCAELYYSKLMKISEISSMHGSITRNYAASLQDDAQQILNEWLTSNMDKRLASTSDQTKERLPIMEFTEKVRSIPSCLARAAELLGSKHYMYNTLKARKYFFEGYLIANTDLNINYKKADKALDNFYEALRWQSDLPQAYWQISMVHGLNKQQPDSAEYYALKAIELNPLWIKPYTQLAFIYIVKYHQLDRAKHYLNQAFNIDSTSSDAWLVQGAYYYNKQNYSKAEECYKNALKYDSTYAVNFNNLGLVYMATGRNIEAELWFVSALKLDSSFAVTYNNLGVIKRRLNQFPESEFYFKRALEIDSTFVMAYNNLGNLYSSKRLFVQAEEQYKNALLIDSSYALAYNNLGITCFHTQRYKEAEYYFNKAIISDPSYTDAYNNLAIIYKGTRRYNEAENILKIIIAIDSSNASVYNSIGAVYMETHRYEEAEMALRKATQLNPNFSLAYYNLGKVYQKLVKWEESVIEFEKSIQIGGPKAAKYANIGFAYLHLENRKNEVLNTFNIAIDNDKNWPDTYIYLSMYYLKKNDVTKSLIYIEKALEIGIERGELSFDYLSVEPVFARLRNEDRWKSLMKKYNVD